MEAWEKIHAVNRYTIEGGDRQLTTPGRMLLSNTKWWENGI
jgi:hypothetical protein